MSRESVLIHISFSGALVITFYNFIKWDILASNEDFFDDSLSYQKNHLYPDQMVKTCQIYNTTKHYNCLTFCLTFCFKNFCLDLSRLILNSNPRPKAIFAPPFVDTLHHIPGLRLVVSIESAVSAPVVYCTAYLIIGISLLLSSRPNSNPWPDRTPRLSHAPAQSSTYYIHVPSSNRNRAPPPHPTEDFSEKYEWYPLWRHEWHVQLRYYVYRKISRSTTSDRRRQFYPCIKRKP